MLGLNSYKVYFSVRGSTEYVDISAKDIVIRLEGVRYQYRFYALGIL